MAAAGPGARPDASAASTASPGTAAATAPGPTAPASTDEPPPTWSPLLVDLALHNLEQADLTLQAARAAGVPIAAGHDWAPI